MSKKSLRKLEHLRRLQALYGDSKSAPVASDSPVATNPVDTPVATTTSNRSVSVRQDIRYLGLVIGLMLILLLGAYWLASNSNLDQALINLIKTAL